MPIEAVAVWVVLSLLIADPKVKVLSTSKSILADIRLIDDVVIIAVSKYAILSTNKSLHSKVVDPKSKVLSLLGIKFVPIDELTNK